MKENPPTPNLFIPGFEKAGSTFLYDILSQVPDIHAPKTKEPKIFYENKSSEKIYEECSRIFSSHSDEPFILDGTPSYLNKLDRIEILKRYTQDPYFIILLRDPIERARSHYKMMKNLGSVPDVSLLELFEMVNRGDKEVQWLKGVFGLGLYFEQVKRVSLLFPEACTVLFFEDLISDVKGELQKLQSELGVSIENIDLEKVRKNETPNIKGGLAKGVVRNLKRIGKKIRPALSVSAYDKIKKVVFFLVSSEKRGEVEDFSVLVDYYKDDVQSLGRMLGRLPVSWKTRYESVD